MQLLASTKSIDSYKLYDSYLIYK